MNDKPTPITELNEFFAAPQRPHTVRLGVLPGETQAEAAARQDERTRRIQAQLAAKRNR